MRSITKTWQDNDVLDLNGVISIKYDTEQSRLIRQCVVYDEDETRQGRDLSYRFNLCWTQNWTFIDDPKGRGMVYDEEQIG